MSASDTRIFADLGLTHTLNCTDELRPRQHCPNYKQVRLADSLTQDLSEAIPQAVAFLKSAVDSGGRVLVHCQRGVSRSVSMVVAYLIMESHMTCEQAIEMIKVRSL